MTCQEGLELSNMPTRYLVWGEQGAIVEADCAYLQIETRHTARRALDPLPLHLK